MSDRFWPQSETEQHPRGGLLLLFVEGDLEDREAALVRQHLADCWDCRVRCEELEKGIHDYVVARRDVLIPRLPQPPSSRHSFNSMLHAEWTGAETLERSICGRFVTRLR